MRRLIVSALLLPLLAGCALVHKHGETAAAELGARAARAVYDPLAPNWKVDAIMLDDEHVKVSMRMKSLVSGGEGEARQLFARTVRRLAEAGGFAAYEIIRYEEGIESTRPFSRRVADGEARLLRARI